MTAATYTPMFDGAMVASLQGRGGYITGYDGQLVPFNERFFDGGDTFRGFALAGIGPRDIVAPSNTGALGGTVHAIGTAQMRFPSLIPESYGVGLSLFTDFGTLGRLDNLSGRPALHRRAIFRHRHLREGQSGLPRLGRHQRNVEIALRPGADRSRPALREDLL